MSACASSDDGPDGTGCAGGRTCSESDDAGSGGADAGSGGADAGSNGQDAGSNGADAGSNGADAGGGAITHGSQLTVSAVGPAGIGISSFTNVSGGTFTGTALSGWGSLARTVGADGETIDGFSFPQDA